MKKKWLPKVLVVFLMFVCFFVGYLTGDSNGTEKANEILRIYDDGIGSHMRMFHDGDPIYEDMIYMINGDVKKKISEWNK